MTAAKPRWYQIFSREWLKGFAMLFMLFDHAYMTVVHVAGYTWMTQIGRIAFPIFAFQIAEGYTHTASKKKYLLHLFVFALISEIPYNLMMGGAIIGPFHQNVMFTFVLAVLGLALLDKVRALRAPVVVRALLVGVICVASVVAGTLCFVDYTGFGVLTVLLFYIAKWMPRRYLEMAVQFLGLWFINWVLLGGKVILLANGFEFPEQGLALLSLLFIWMYNGKKALTGASDRAFRSFGYLFYPAHILALSLTALFLL
ncbi:MAG: TraX family protein [Oscillospiraceae bacterium]|nr:TraX family protein [Oscillospiraceae bacterium]